MRGSITVKDLVLAAVEEIFIQREVAFAQIDESTKLYGVDGTLDSLSLVTLIVDIEQKIAEEYGLSITIADDRAMSQKNSPFTTVKSLNDYVSMLIEDTPKHDRS